jgi:hypothetical protein
MRSDFDRLVGDLVRHEVPLRCPVCGLVARWACVTEYGDHRQACAVIELGCIVGAGEVEKKPAGYRWVEGQPWPPDLTRPA